MKRVLAESENYKIISEYEVVSLHFKTKERDPVFIGDFYGDPDSALISKDEKYIAMAGCGLIVYKIQEPFFEYNGEENDNQYFIFNNSDPNMWWTSNVYQSLDDIDLKFFRFANEEDSIAVPYKFDVSTNTASKLL